MFKEAYSVQMRYDVPDAEKLVAEKAETYFKQLIEHIKDLSKYLDLIYEPFKKCQSTDGEMLVQYRKTFRQYRNMVQKKFSNILRKAHKCVALMNEFSVDTATEELMDSFIGAIKEEEQYIDTFVSIFSNLNSPDFRNYLVSTVDSIKKQSNQIEQIIKDRIFDHIDTNILAKNWATSVSERLKEPKIERVPLVVQLYRERQEALKGAG